MKQMPNIDSEMTLKNYERELELCQKAGGDIERYLRLSFDLLQLEQIRLGLQSGIDVEQYMNPKLSWIEMENIRNTLESGIDMSPYEEKGYDWLQCNEIREGIREGLDVTLYEDIHFLAPQMREIRKGLVGGLDVSIYARPEYDWFQMREIRKGLEEKLDVKKFANPSYKFLTMRAIRKTFSKGISLLPYVEKGYHGRELMELSRGLVAGNDIGPFLENGYNAEQLEQINYAYEAGVNIVPYLSREFHGVQLSEITKGLKKGLDVFVYAKPVFNWFQMREIRFGMEDRVDVKEYTNPDLSAEQMAEIRKGLLSGVDVSQYNKVYYEPEQMAEFRHLLEERAEEEDRELQRVLETVENPKGEKGKPVEKPEEETEGEAEEETEELDSFVVVSSDKMQAILNLPSPANAEEYDMKIILKMLSRKNVKQGIYKDRIQELLENKQYFTDVVVAEGKPPVDGEDGKFLYYFRKKLKRRPKVLENGAVDYKNMELFEVVKDGQLIAEYQPATAGGFGYNVLGELLSPKKGRELPPLHGKGFMMSEDKKKYYSLMDGIIEWKQEGEIEIRNIYTISGNVDASTGNINFNGDVNISGNVENGFSVTATGNVVIDGYCEGGVIHAGKDILIRKGCQGQSVGELQAGGTVTGKFFESVKIQAEGNVEASYLLNCHVKTAGKMFVNGKRGLIIGGYTCAKQGVDCYGIGNVAEIRTTIEVGIDKEDMAEYQELMKKIAKLDSEIHTFEEAVSKIMEQENRDEKKQGLYEKLTKAIYALKSTKKKLLKERAVKMEQLTRQKGARILVSGTVHPGTRIIMHTEVHNVTQEYSNVQFVKKEDKVDMVLR